RHSNTESLNLPAVGVQIGDHGLISVDSSFQTNVPHIYAAGDVIGFPALASTSMEQARRAVRHAFGMGFTPEHPSSCLTASGPFPRSGWSVRPRTRSRPRESPTSSAAHRTPTTPGDGS